MADEVQETPAGTGEESGAELNADFAAAFSEATKDKPAEKTPPAATPEKKEEGGGEEDPSKAKPVPEDGKKPAEPPPTDKKDEPAGKKEGEKEEPPSGEVNDQDLMLQAAKKYEEQPPAATPPAATPGAAAAATVPPVISAEDITAALESFKADDLPDVKIKIGDEDVSIRDAAQDFPESFALATVLGSAFAEKIVTAKVKDITAKNKELTTVINGMLWWDAVHEVHPDGRKLSRSSEFREWLGKQPDAVKKMADDKEDPSGAILVLNAYKAGIAKKKAAEYDKGQRGKHQETVDLHKGSLRTKETAGKKTGAEDEKDDFSAGFAAGVGAAR